MAAVLRLAAPDKVIVGYHGKTVGNLALTGEGLMAFEYDDAWLASGFSISPLSLPLEKRVFIAKAEPLDGVFGIFADSLPDGWGRLLVDRALAAHGIYPHGISALTRLSIVGASGMGALEFEPVTDVPSRFEWSDLDRIAEECSKILKTEYSDDLDRIFALGGSSGGARPKILTSIESEEWIVKFPSSVDSRDIGKDEYEIAGLARQCGLDFPETRLFPSKRCAGYFGVKRFDRSSEGKVHMASAGALLETSHRIPNLDYETLFRLTALLTDSAAEIEKLYRLMCFNVFIGNRDDHAKNFSFLYTEENGWRLSPAYDLTTNPGMYGEHATAVEGKGRDIPLADLTHLGVKAGLAEVKARSIATDMQACVHESGRLAAF